jgi:hypothetical protein
MTRRSPPGAGTLSSRGGWLLPKHLTNHTVNEDAELESATGFSIVMGAPFQSVRLQPRQLEGLECQRVMKKSE